MTDLIRWTELPHGVLAGYAGTNPVCLMEIHPPDERDGEWVLQSWLPGQVGTHPHGASADELKARAEELLREFASSVGAVFPADLGEKFWRDDERRQIQAVATANARDDCIALLRDKADEAGDQGNGTRAMAFHDAADLIEGDDRQ